MSRSAVSLWALWLLAAVVVLDVSRAALAEENPFGEIRVAANRSRYVGACPVEIVFTANINMGIPHPKGLSFSYYWTRSDGAKGPVRDVRPSPNQRMMIVRDSWRLGAAGQHYDVSERLFVNSGNTHLEHASPVVSVTCR
jgi:hypothetical protein